MPPTTIMAAPMPNIRIAPDRCGSFSVSPAMTPSSRIWGRKPSEELGLVGATMIMILFALLIIRGFWIAIHARDRFGSLMAVGVTTQIALQTFLNIAVVARTGFTCPAVPPQVKIILIDITPLGIHTFS